MSHTPCFPGLPYDERLTRMLRANEAFDFVRLCCLNAEYRDPTYIPARRMLNMRLKLGMTGKAGEEKWAKRLVRWSAPHVQLVQIGDDGGLLVTYLLEQDEDAEFLRVPSGQNGQTARQDGQTAPERSLQLGQGLPSSSHIQSSSHNGNGIHAVPIL